MVRPTVIGPWGVNTAPHRAPSVWLRCCPFARARCSSWSSRTARLSPKPKSFTEAADARMADVSFVDASRSLACARRSVLASMLVR